MEMQLSEESRCRRVVDRCTCASSRAFYLFDAQIFMSSLIAPSSAGRWARTR